MEYAQFVSNVSSVSGKRFCEVLLWTFQADLFGNKVQQKN